MQMEFNTPFGSKQRKHNMKKETIILEANGEFPFTFYIEKASVADDLVNLDIEGIASTTNVDHDKERMSKEALYAMESTINKEGVPLRVEHQKEGDAIIGRVFKAWVDERNQLHVRARLDKSHTVSKILHDSMKQGLKMGLSVGGIVKRALREFSDSTGGYVKTFYDVALQEVSVTPRPANYDSWVVAKSIAKDMKDAENYSENAALKRQFLFENSQLDYLQAFAKSVPDKAWHKVESPEVIKEINNIMKNQDIEKKEDEMDTEDTEKAVTRDEFNSLSKGFKDLVKAVANGFATMTKAMDTSAKDQVNSDKDKPKDINGTAKSAKAKKAMDGDAKDQGNPDKNKPDDINGTAKAEKDEDEDTEKSEADGTDENGEREKTNKKADQEDTYDIETVNRAIKSMDKLAKKVKKTEDETKETEKAEDDDEKETEKAEDSEDEKDTEKAAEDTEEMDEKKMKTIHPLDAFVVSVTKAMEAVVERMEKKGHRVLGFEKSIIDGMKNDPEMQAEIIKLLKIPGFKKSVSMGVPFMATKDGRRISLINAPERVQKSTEEDSKKDFRQLYKEKYSSTSEQEVDE